MEFVIGKDVIRGMGGFTHVLYDSITNGHNIYWESKNALRDCKKYAKDNGFTTLRIISKTWRSKDKIYFRFSCKINLI